MSPEVGDSPYEKLTAGYIRVTCAISSLIQSCIYGLWLRVSEVATG